MSQQNRTTLKNYFRTGQRPTQEQFANMIDSSLNLTDDGIFDDGGNLGLGHNNPASKLSVNGNVAVSPNNDSAPDNGLFVHGNVGIGAGFTNPTAQLAVKGSVYIGNTETTDPGSNSLKVDGHIATEGNLSTGGNLSITGTLHTVGDTTMDGTLTLADAKHVATDEVRARDSGGLKLHEDGGKGLLVHDGSGDVSADGTLTLADAKHVATDEVRARDSGGLKLHEDGGKGLLVHNGSGDISADGTLTLADAKHVATDEVRARDSGGLKLYVASGANGLMIHDNGNVSIGRSGGEEHKLHVEGNTYINGDLTTSGSIRGDSLSLTGQVQETNYVGTHEGDLHDTFGITVPGNRVVVGISFRRYRKASRDVDTYTFALRYR